MSGMNGERITFRRDLFEYNQHCQNLFHFFNKRFFRGKLPHVAVGFYNDPKDHNYGSTIRLDKTKYPAYIILHPHFKEWEDTLQMTLLHEMIHVKLLGRHGHGKKFKKELQRLIDAGAFTPLL